MIPVKTLRGGRGRRPGWRNRRGSAGGNKGSIRPHNSSLTRGFMAHLPFSSLASPSIVYSRCPMFLIFSGGSIMKPIVLSPQQRRDIERRRKETLDRRVYQRLTAVLTVAEGKNREEVAHLLGIGLSQLGEWLRLYRNKGLDALCLLHYKGDPGKLTAEQVGQLKEKVSTGCFRNSEQIR